MATGLGIAVNVIRIDEVIKQFERVADLGALDERADLEQCLWCVRVRAFASFVVASPSHGDRDRAGGMVRVVANRTHRGWCGSHGGGELHSADQQHRNSVRCSLLLLLWFFSLVGCCYLVPCCDALCGESP